VQKHRWGCCQGVLALTWEEVTDKAQKERHIIVHKLWQVGVSQSTHQHESFAHVRGSSLEGSRHDQHTLQCT